MHESTIAVSSATPHKIGEKNVNLIFGIPMLSTLFPDVDELNQALASLILDAERQRSSMEQSNMGGWQSEKTLQTLANPAIAQLLSLIDVGVYCLMSEIIGEEKVDSLEKKWKIAAWANVNRSGHFNGVHYHVGGFWSGVYYVSANPPSDTSGDGLIIFRNPTL